MQGRKKCYHDTNVWLEGDWIVKIKLHAILTFSERYKICQECFCINWSDKKVCYACLGTTFRDVSKRDAYDLERAYGRNTMIEVG